MRYIKINNVNYPHPKNFRMQAVPNTVAALTTMNGNNVADVNGWYYNDVTLTWDYLESADIVSLMNATNPINGTFQFTFDDMVTGESKTVTAIRKSVGGQKIPTVTQNGVHWADITMTLSFPQCYHN